MICEAGSVFAFAGIGRPEKFVASLEEAGAIVTGTQFFADHHPSGAARSPRLKPRAGERSLVTTEKDFVRLDPQRSRRHRGAASACRVRRTSRAGPAADRIA